MDQDFVSPYQTFFASQTLSSGQNLSAGQNLSDSRNVADFQHLYVDMAVDPVFSFPTKSFCSLSAGQNIPATMVCALFQALIMVSAETI